MNALDPTKTPNEVFFGAGDAVVAKLAVGPAQARTERMAKNGTSGRGTCASGGQDE